MKHSQCGGGRLELLNRCSPPPFPTGDFSDTFAGSTDTQDFKSCREQQTRGLFGSGGHHWIRKHSSSLDPKREVSVGASGVLCLVSSLTDSAGLLCLVCHLSWVSPGLCSEFVRCVAQSTWHLSALFCFSNFIKCPDHASVFFISFFHWGLLIACNSASFS